MKAYFKNQGCDQTKMNLSKKENALYMHCLTAENSGGACPEGEVSKEIIES